MQESAGAVMLQSGIPSLKPVSTCWLHFRAHDYKEALYLSFPLHASARKLELPFCWAVFDPGMDGFQMLPMVACRTLLKCTAAQIKGKQWIRVCLFFQQAQWMSCCHLETAVLPQVFAIPVLILVTQLRACAHVRTRTHVHTCTGAVSGGTSHCVVQ